MHTIYLGDEELEIKTAEVPVVKAALIKHRKRGWLWRLVHFRFGVFDKPDLVIRIPLPQQIKPSPLTSEQVEALSARGAAKRATQKLQSLQNTEAIDLRRVVPLR